MAATERRPIHTVYGGAHLFRKDIAKKLGNLALNSFIAHAPKNSDLLSALGVKLVGDKTFFDLGEVLHSKICKKLKEEPIEDFRVDFEDGLGERRDQEEDLLAEGAGRELASGLKEKILPPFIGIRIKSLSSESKKRALKTLQLVMRELLEASEGVLPQNFCVTLPKVESVTEVEILSEKLAKIEETYKIVSNSIKIELIIETPKAIFTETGVLNLTSLVKAASGRCGSCHFGLYDFTSRLGIASHAQSLRHPYADFVRFLMQCAVVDKGIRVVDSITNIIPSGQDTSKVQAAWKEHYLNIAHALRCGIYQGWDLHPAQIPVRYAATYLFFFEGLGEVKRRLGEFQRNQRRSTLSAGAFDDHATVLGLINFLKNALCCGAVQQSDLKEFVDLL